MENDNAYFRLIQRIVKPDLANHVKVCIIGIGSSGRLAAYHAQARQLDSLEIAYIDYHPQIDAVVMEDKTLTIEHLENTQERRQSWEELEFTWKDYYDYIVSCSMIILIGGINTHKDLDLAKRIVDLCEINRVLSICISYQEMPIFGLSKAVLAETDQNTYLPNIDAFVAISSKKIAQRLGAEWTPQNAVIAVNDMMVYTVRGLTDTITKTYFCRTNLDDTRSVISKMGPARVGMGIGIGIKRAELATMMALSDLMIDTQILLLRRLIVTITGGFDISIHDYDKASRTISSFLTDDAFMKFDVIVSDRIKLGFLQVVILAGDT